MAKFQLMRRRKKSSAATFHVNEDFSAGWKKRNAEKMGFGRTLSTAFTLIFALGAIYVSLHYVPAFMSPSTVVRVSDADETAIAKERGAVMSVLGPYWDSLLARRTYVWANESMEVQFRRNGAKNMSLIVERCDRKPVLEIFKCEVVSQDRIRVTKASGTRIMRIDEPGFYQFREEYTGAEPRVIWRRA